MTSPNAQISIVLLLSAFSFLLAQLSNKPSILFLLFLGISSGPVMGLLDPDKLLGDLLVPLVSIAVGIILFEGGLTLHKQDFKHIGRTVFLLISLGALLSFVLTSCLAYFVLGLPTGIALLLGSITVVSGPTVVQPLLRQVRPMKPLSAILRWEGILIDPVGVLLTVIVFDAILTHSMTDTFLVVGGHILKNLLVGTCCGLLSGMLLTWLLEQHLLVDALHIPVTLTVLLGAQTLADTIHHESGLLAVTILGFYLANYCAVHVQPIIEFTETLRDMLIGALFIVLGARLSPDALQVINFSSLVFLILLIVVVRPAVVFATCAFEPLSKKQKLFLAAVAPRGIVAASVASLISLRLVQQNFVQAETLLPYTFLVISGTVIVYSLGSAPLAKMLGLQLEEPQGVVFVGAHAFARELAQIIQSLGFRVLLVDTNPRNVAEARQMDLEGHHGNILSEEMLEHLDFEDVGKLFALTSNDEANSLAAVHFGPLFGREGVFQFSPVISKNFLPSEKLLVQPYGKILFSSRPDLPELLNSDVHSWTIHTKKGAAISTSPNELPLMGVTTEGKLVVATSDVALHTQGLSVLVSLECKEKRG
jgi:NhaP-type Na+/H+ or K+/H+ antiporter